MLNVLKTRRTKPAPRVLPPCCRQPVPRGPQPPVAEFPKPEVPSESRQLWSSHRHTGIIKIVSGSFISAHCLLDIQQVDTQCTRYQRVVRVNGDGPLCAATPTERRGEKK